MASGLSLGSQVQGLGLLVPISVSKHDIPKGILHKPKTHRLPDPQLELSLNHKPPEIEET